MTSLMEKLAKDFEAFSEYGKASEIDNYVLMGSPIKIITLILLYLFFVKWWGPKLMENRKPFQINNILIVYNIFQIIINGFLAAVGTYVFFSKGYSIRCLPLHPPNSPELLMENQLMHYYYMIKVVDLLDTVFFVLRKKYNQVSFLHVYHHVIVLFFSYVYTKYIPGGHGTILGLINSYVHVFMYLYYFLTAFKPELKNSIWWKKHITHLQIVQFVLLIVHFGHPLFFTTCKYPLLATFFPFTQNVLMLVLFSNFYYHAYIKKRSKKLTD